MPQTTSYRCPQDLIFFLVRVLASLISHSPTRLHPRVCCRSRALIRLPCLSVQLEGISRVHVSTMIATTVTALIFAYLFVNIVAVLWRNKEAHKFFEKNSPRLPVLPEPSIIDGHGRSLLSHDKNWKLMEEFHEKYGPTFGFYKMNEPWVATKDLDLIKLIEIDEAHKHINRANLGIPLTEFNHSVWQLEDDKWRKVRRVISAPLT